MAGFVPGVAVVKEEAEEEARAEEEAAEAAAAAAAAKARVEEAAHSKARGARWKQRRQGLAARDLL